MPAPAPAKPAASLSVRSGAGKAVAYAHGRLHRAYAGCRLRQAYGSREPVLGVRGDRDRRRRGRQLAGCVPLRQRLPVALRGQLGAELLGRGGVDLERPLVLEHDAVGLARELDRREVVEHVLAHRRRVALERVAVAGGVGLAELDELTRLERDAGHLRRQRLLARRARVLAARGDEPVPAAEHGPRRVGLPVALARVRPVDEEAVATNDPDPAAPLARRGGLRAQLVLVAAHREAHVELFDRVVTG